MTYANHAFTPSELVLVADANVTLEQLIHFAGPGRTVSVTPEVCVRVRQSRQALEQAVADGRVIYGVNTSVGGFVDYLVPLDQAAKLQVNLIQAVASNVGGYFDDRDTRAAMLARIVSLARGNSGISLKNFGRFLSIYNAGVVPCVPMKGSLGASGDLGPLAAIAAVLTGCWKARVGGVQMSGAQALATVGLPPLELSYKEGLALVNGTSAMVAVAARNVLKARSLLDTYIRVSGLSFEGLAAKSKPFDPRVHQLKPHDGQLRIATALWNQLAGSGLIVDESALSALLSNRFSAVAHQEDQPIEDCYSIRCTPQILGPVLETIEFAARTIANELNSSNDNPLISCHDGEIFHNGHFHGQYVAAAMDYLTIAVITLCNLSDRRIDKLLTPANNHGLPGFLCREDPGLRLGLMGGQFMSTSLTAENRSLATPLSIQTLTSTGDFQDVVSFGLVAARRTQEVLVNTSYVAAFELICACQAIDIRGADKLSPSGKALYAHVRESVPYLDHDAILTDYVERVVATVFGDAQ